MNELLEKMRSVVNESDIPLSAPEVARRIGASGGPSIGQPRAYRGLQKLARLGLIEKTEGRQWTKLPASGAANGTPSAPQTDRYSTALGLLDVIGEALEARDARKAKSCTRALVEILEGF